MKTKILSLIFLLGMFSTSFANNIPDSKTKLISNDKFEISYDSGTLVNIFDSASIVENRSFEFKTKEVVAFIQVFNSSGAIEYQLPVGSDVVTLGTSLFESGNYKLGFLIDSYHGVQYADVKVK